MVPISPRRAAPGGESPHHSPLPLFPGLLTRPTALLHLHLGPPLGGLSPALFPGDFWKFSQDTSWAFEEAKKAKKGSS